MEITPEKLAVYKRWVTEERRVVAVINKNDTALEVDGQLKAAHERGIMIRPKGRMVPEMIDPEDLESLELYDERPKRIEPKRMAHIVYGNIRQHLADRHGFALEDINGPDANENWAYDEHEKEHAVSAPKMSHFHEG